MIGVGLIKAGSSMQACEMVNSLRGCDDEAEVCVDSEFAKEGRDS